LCVVCHPKPFKEIPSLGTVYRNLSSGERERRGEREKEREKGREKEREKERESRIV